MFVLKSNVAFCRQFLRTVFLKPCDLSFSGGSVVAMRGCWECWILMLRTSVDAHQCVLWMPHEKLPTHAMCSRHISSWERQRRAVNSNCVVRSLRLCLTAFYTFSSKAVVCLLETDWDCSIFAKCLSLRVRLLWASWKKKMQEICLVCFFFLEVKRVICCHNSDRVCSCSSFLLGKFYFGFKSACGLQT